MQQIVLPGSELEAVPQEDRSSPIVLRIVQVFPHGTAFRYDIEYYGLEPGTFDLKKYLRRKDGSSTADLPALPVTVRSSLPAGQITPHALEINPGPQWLSYRMTLVMIGVAWILGLAAIVYFLFLRRRRSDQGIVQNQPQSLADRLRPLVEGAIAGKLSQPELANLERTLLAYWRKRLGLEAAEPESAIAALRAHADAGPLLEQLEEWLHRADSGRAVDTVVLLAPYQHLPANALEGPNV